MSRTIFPDGVDTKGRSYADYQWSRFKNFAPADMFVIVDQHVFRFLRTLGGEGSTYATHMRDARFTIPNPSLLPKAVDGLDGVAMVDRDTKGDVYEYMLAKIATAGQNGQFRTPRHITTYFAVVGIVHARRPENRPALSRERQKADRPRLARVLVGWSAEAIAR
jgi:type I restriction enzyme M protein